jgi:hypothetical protein
MTFLSLSDDGEVNDDESSVNQKIKTKNIGSMNFDTTEVLTPNIGLI